MSFEPFTFILERLADFFTNQIDLFCTDGAEEIRILQQRVEIADALLRNVDEVQRKADMDRELRITVQQVMAILGEIEDFLDSQVEEEDSQLRLTPFSHFSVGSLKRKRSAVKGAREIKEKLNDAIQRLNGYQLSGDSPHVIPRRRYPTQPDNFREEFIVGLKEDVEAYVADLVPTEANHGSSIDLAIFGMGGSGKTTATRLVYNHKQISEHFDRRAWVCVSQTWDTNQLLRQICRQVGMQPPNDDDDERLILSLKEFLQSHSCFFVLDDVWEVKALRELLPPLRSRSSNNGGKAPSRVLVTTRNKEILNFPQNDFSAKKIRPLTPEESWDLFSKTICRNRRDDWNLEGEFENLGKEMLEKCRGLPLAIVALGGLLSSRDTVPEWESIKADVVRRISNHMGSDDDYGVVKEILELSYFDLPYYLKPCFLYLGIFPEDSKIDVERLIQLWIAEGFVKVDQNSSSTTLETLARDFLDELAHRCMVEKDYGRVISCIRIHDLMRDLCILKAKDWKFFKFLPPPTSTSTCMDQNSCRIILHKQSWTSIDIRARSTKIRLRSYIMLHDQFSPITSRGLSLSFVGMKYLRVLCLVGVELKDIGTGMKLGDLILLRHLELRGCTVSKGHALSIKKLRNLLSLIICKGVEFTNCGEALNLVVGGMQHLRHLRVRIFGVGELGVGNKSNLQTLEAFSGEWVTKELPHASPSLQDLKVLKISSSAQLEGVYEFFSNPCEHLLHTLMLTLNAQLEDALEFNLHKLELPRHCTSLALAGRIQTHPHQPFGQFPRRLLKLCLSSSKIGDEEQFKAALAQLEELKYLLLHFDAYTGDRLSMAGLPKLQEFYLSALSNLKEWRIESGALCKLQKLGISHCRNLQRLPQQISCVSSLKRLTLFNMPWTFKRRLQRPSEYDAEGEDFHLVRHIPSLEFINCNED